MNSRPLHPPPRLSRQWASLALAVPQVVGHRLARMALAGPVPSARDRREFERMCWEKSAAWLESWTAMWLEFGRAGFALTTAALAGGPWSAAIWTEKMAAATWSVAAQGLRPVHRRAAANSRRLARAGRGRRAG